MEGVSPLGRLGGFALAMGGTGFFLAGALHPSGARGQSFQEAMVSMLQSPTWPLAHWIALASTMLVTWALWLLVDDGWTSGSVAARAGGRLAIVSGLFMAAQFAVEIAARHAAEAYAAGEAAPIVALVDPMQAIGWPAFALGFILLAVGIPDAAPRWVVILGVTGAAAIGLGGILAQGLHFVQAGPLFIGGNLWAIWMVWAGIRVARSRPVRAYGAPQAA